MTAIEFVNVSKTFHRHLGPKLISSYFSEWFGGQKTEPFYALKDVSFQIPNGECVGVVGANGAGKSTLLSLVTRLAPPNEGNVHVEGRVAALLDLGSGFHPDLTGRENVMLNASLLGFSRHRAHEYFEQIVDFAELSDFMDEPLRTYSNGMILRLAFSVAVNLDPEVLVIDEVLAVGDQSFQTKCMERIFQFKHSGKTLLVVSHVGAVIQQLCDRALWLDHGSLIMDGDACEVVSAYEGRKNAASTA